jgi:hypothetical protein
MSNLKVVPVSEYRGAVEHLERIFNVDRHACVGKNERDNWADVARRMLTMYEGLECKRAKPDDVERLSAIVKKITDYLNLNNKPSEGKSMSESSQATPAKKAFFNVFITNEFEIEGVKKTRWTQVGVGFPHKDGEGINIEITPGLSVSGSLVVLLAKNDEAKPDAQPK